MGSRRMTKRGCEPTCCLACFALVRLSLLSLSFFSLTCRVLAVSLLCFIFPVFLYLRPHYLALRPYPRSYSPGGSSSLLTLFPTSPLHHSFHVFIFFQFMFKFSIPLSLIGAGLRRGEAAKRRAAFALTLATRNEYQGRCRSKILSIQSLAVRLSMTAQTQSSLTSPLPMMMIDNDQWRSHATEAIPQLTQVKILRMLPSAAFLTPK